MQGVDQRRTRHSTPRALTFTSSHTRRTTTYRHPSSAPRQHSYTTFMHGGVKVCRKTFVFLHLGEEAKSSLLENGLSPRLHGNTKRLPHNTTSFADTQQVANFIKTAHAILLPGRIPGYKRSDLQLLPSSTTKRNVWRLYCDSLETLSTTHHRVSYSTFCAMWQKLVPHIMVTKPMTDLCWVCQKNSVAIMRAANQPDELKSEVYK